MPKIITTDQVGLILLNYLKENTKINKDALLAVTELIELFMMEACKRALQESDGNKVTIEDVQKIIVQLLLDFC